MSADANAEKLAEIRARWSGVTPGPWFWWGNTDVNTVALCGHQPGLGVCEVISLVERERTMDSQGARDYREYLLDYTDSTIEATEEQLETARREILAVEGGEDLSEEEIERLVQVTARQIEAVNEELLRVLIRDEWMTDRWGEPVKDTHLALTDENYTRRAVDEVAVYQVARNQGLPEDTPRDHPKVYRADICDVRNVNGRALAAAPGDIAALLEIIEDLRAELAQIQATDVENLRRGDGE